MGTYGSAFSTLHQLPLNHLLSVVQNVVFVFELIHLKISLEEAEKKAHSVLHTYRQSISFTFHLTFSFLFSPFHTKLSTTKLIISFSLLLVDFNLSQPNFLFFTITSFVLDVHGPSLYVFSNFFFIPFLSRWLVPLSPTTFKLSKRPGIGRCQHIFISSGSMIQVISAKLWEDVALLLFNSSLVL